MPWLLTFGILAISLAVVWRLITRSVPDQELSAGGKTGPSIVLAVIGVALVLFSMFTVVSTKNIGIETVFGRPQGSLDNGLHFKAPWVHVTEMDGAVQTDTYEGENATKVRLANESIATVDNSIRWRIIPDQADELYRDYRDFDNIRDSLVTRQLNDVLNEVFADYDPLAVDESGQIRAIDSGDFSAEVTKRLQERIGEQIVVLDVIIPLVQFDKATQSRIDAYQEEIANTRIAIQKQRTAEAQAEANRIMSESGLDNPYVLVAQCMDTFATMVDKNQPIPAGGINCWPGSDSTLVVPAATAPKTP